MKWTWRFVLPVILGVVAAGANYAALRMRLAPRAYVQASSKLRQGVDFFDAERIEKVELAVDIPSALPWSDRKVLYKLPVSRDLQPGDLILRRDIVLPEDELQLQPGEVALNISLEGIRFEPNLLRVGREVGFAIADMTANAGDSAAEDSSASASSEPRYDAVGPFRIVSVGARISQEELAGPENSSGSSVTTVSVATPSQADGRLDARAARLLQANRDKSIVAIVLYAAPQLPVATTTAASEPTNTETGPESEGSP